MFVFALGLQEELGRGGRYVCADGEPATGLTLLPEAVLRAAPASPPRHRVYVPPDAPAEQAARLRRDGYATVDALDAEGNSRAEAARLGCSAVLGADGIVTVEEAG